MVRQFLVAVAAVSVAAPVLAKGSPPNDRVLDLSLATKGCLSTDPAEVIVCGKRGTSRYRIDPTVLQVIREKESAENPPQPSGRSASAEKCPIGVNSCPGGGTIDLIGPLMVIARSLLSAAEGEDWREPFRTRPDHDQLHEQEKSRRQ